jgi:hypothetical protein
MILPACAQGRHQGTVAGCEGWMYSTGNWTWLDKDRERRPCDCACHTEKENAR